MGAGKSSVLAEASDILASRHITHAAIDLDALGLAYFPSANGNDDLMYCNLESICQNYNSAGVNRLMLARALESRAELERVRKAAAAARPVVCRLTASVEVMEQRVKKRELGILQPDFVARVAKLNTILDRARLEDFSVSSENRSLTEIAREVLVKAAWIPE
ncbi:MAG TPA: hypothetical protein VE077_05020 [Candidatus Methylomirabilis sp.]|nr:hypothetical protein [Candidatus Methylomirabilis sp.]